MLIPTPVTKWSRLLARRHALYPTDLLRIWTATGLARPDLQEYPPMRVDGQQAIVRLAVRDYDAAVRISDLWNDSIQAVVSSALVLGLHDPIHMPHDRRLPQLIERLIHGDADSIVADDALDADGEDG